jgi:hypothetical protein
MGYSLSQEQWEKLEQNKREGRLCCVSTGRGGCFNRATRRLTQHSWPYEADRQAGKTPDLHVAVACARHATPDWQEGLNFTTLKVEKF